MKTINRRHLLKSSALLGAGAFLLPRFSIGQSGPAPSKRVNLAFVGCNGIALTYIGEKSFNVVAMCDVDSKRITETKAKFPHLAQIKEFSDYRVMLDKMGADIDIVVVSTPDHTHFPITMEAMQRGKHVFTQKPLTHDVWQARTLVKAAEKYKVQTCMGNQGHTTDGIRQMREWYEAGLLGQVKSVKAWFPGGAGNRLSSVYPPPAEPVPNGLDWDNWVGPVAETPYNKAYAPFNWRQFVQFGSGKLGDWFCHICDGPVWILDLFEPTAIEAVKLEDEKDGYYPAASIIKMDFPSRGDKAPCTLTWHDGKNKPAPPADANGTKNEKGGKEFGSYWEGGEDSYFLDNRSDHPTLCNKEKMAELKRSNAFPSQKYPRVPKGGPLQELVRAVSGEGPAAGSSFDYAARLTEVGCLGMIAQRFGGRIEWDSKNMKITNRPELNTYLKQPVRKGWEYGEDLWKA